MSAPAKPLFDPRLESRHASGLGWRLAFFVSTLVAILSLVTLIATIVNDSFGYMLVRDEVKASELARDGVPLEEQDVPSLVALLEDSLSHFRIEHLNAERRLLERGREELLALVEEEVMKPDVIKTWPLVDSIFNVTGIRREARELERFGMSLSYMSAMELVGLLSEIMPPEEFEALIEKGVEESMPREPLLELLEKHYDAAFEGFEPETRLVWHNWFNPGFVTGDQSVEALYSGIRGAIIGSFLTILVTVLFAFPLGIGAAIYLEEYARDTKLNRLVQTNIYNLAGVPSIIYGMLGLAVFVRMLGSLTSGAMFGAIDDPLTANGRTVLSAGLTLAILVLPIIIINAQEALKAVPRSLREASYAMGATRWQTIWHHVLPSCMDRILTGAVLAVSRGIGETAPLVVVGASFFLTQDPKGLFSKFSTLPIQIYEWSSDPKPEFRNAAAAAILVLMVLLLGINAAAIISRNRFRKKKGLR